MGARQTKNAPLPTYWLLSNWHQFEEPHAGNLIDITINTLGMWMAGVYGWLANVLQDGLCWCPLAWYDWVWTGMVWHAYKCFTGWIVSFWLGDKIPGTQLLISWRGLEMAELLNSLAYH